MIDLGEAMETLQHLETELMLEKKLHEKTRDGYESDIHMMRVDHLAALVEVAAATRNEVVRFLEETAEKQVNPGQRILVLALVAVVQSIDVAPMVAATLATTLAAKKAATP